MKTFTILFVIALAVVLIDGRRGLPGRGRGPPDVKNKSTKDLEPAEDPEGEDANPKVSSPRERRCSCKQGGSQVKESSKKVSDPTIAAVEKNGTTTTTTTGIPDINVADVNDPPAVGKNGTTTTSTTTEPSVD